MNKSEEIDSFRHLYEPRFFKEFYEKEALQKDLQQSLYEKNTPWGLRLQRARMFRVIKLLMSATGNFLEVGCAEGLYVKSYSQTHKDNQIVVGLDISRNYIKKAKERYRSAMWVVGDAQSLPFKERSFDIVLCSEVLEHLPYPKIAFNEACRVSRKHILITVPGEHTPFFYLARSFKLLNLFRKLGVFKEEDNDPGHISRVQMKDLTEWSNANKLCILLLQTTCHFPLPVSFAPMLHLANIFDQIVSKIPVLCRYGIVNIFLAVRYL